MEQLNEQELAAVRGMLSIVQTNGGPEKLAKLLSIGSLTTDIAELEGKISNRIAAKDADAREYDSEISTLRSQADALRVQLRTLSGN